MSVRTVQSSDSTSMPPGSFGCGGELTGTKMRMSITTDGWTIKP